MAGQRLAELRITCRKLSRRITEFALLDEVIFADAGSAAPRYSKLGIRCNGFIRIRESAHLPNQMNLLYQDIPTGRVGYPDVPDV